ECIIFIYYLSLGPNDNDVEMVFNLEKVIIALFSKFLAFCEQSHGSFDDLDSILECLMTILKILLRDGQTLSRRMDNDCASHDSLDRFDVDDLLNELIGLSYEE